MPVTNCLCFRKRYVGFVSNLVEKGTFETVKESELQQLGLSADELASFQMIKDWARIAQKDGGVGSEAEASTMRRQLRDVKEKKARNEQRERVKREAQEKDAAQQAEREASTQQTREASAAGTSARINAAGEESAAAADAAGAAVTAAGRTEHNALCPMLPAITNGQAEYSNERVAPCSATFTCDEGYSLGGHGVTETVIDCVPAGKSAFWSGAPPTCTAVAGSAPDDVDEPR